MTTFPTSYSPALNAIKQSIEGYLSSSQYPILTGTMDGDRLWEGQAIDSKARQKGDTNFIIHFPRRAVNGQNFSAINAVQFEKFEIDITVQKMFSGSFNSGQSRLDAKSDLLNNASKIKSLLITPRAIENDMSGTFTGISSGCLMFIGMTEPNWNWESNAQGETVMTFYGFMSLHK